VEKSAGGTDQPAAEFLQVRAAIIAVHPVIRAVEICRSGGCVGTIRRAGFDFSFFAFV